MSTDKMTPHEKMIWDKLVQIYEAVKDEDRAQARVLVERAKAGKRDSAVVQLRPGTAAILFFDHNKQNRTWSCRVSEEYAEQIALDEWEFHNQGIGFLVSGNLGDGQHRVAGIALGGKPVDVSVTFGMTVASIIAIDTGRRRQAADFLGIEVQLPEAGRKQQMVKQAFATLRRLAGDREEVARPYVLRSGNRDVVVAIKKYDHLLNEAIEIADDSVRGRAKPTFKANEAASLSFLLLLKGWPKAKIMADLDIFQSGESRESEKEPLFVAADQLQKDAQKREGASTSARFAAAIKAFVLHEQGAKAVRVSDIRAAMKPKAGVDASFPGTAQVHSLTA